MKKHIVLMGYMGSGKSTIAGLLSERTRFVHYDLDEFMEREEKNSISTIFQSKGEIYFRKKEAFYLELILSKNEKAIISLGGGTPCYGNNLQTIKNAETVSVYLSASVDALTERLFEEKENRPLIAFIETKELLNEYIGKHLFERGFYYNQADYILKTDGLSAEEIENTIFELLF